MLDIQGQQFHIEEAIDEELPESQDNHFDEEMTTLLSQDSLGTLHDQGMVPPFVGFSSIKSRDILLILPFQFLIIRTSLMDWQIVKSRQLPKDVLITIKESRLVSTNTNTITNYYYYPY